MPGVVLSAFLFAILHLSPFRFLPQFAIGIVLAVLALRSRSIVPGMVLHAGHNALVMVVSAAIGRSLQLRSHRTRRWIPGCCWRLESPDWRSRWERSPGCAATCPACALAAGAIRRERYTGRHEHVKSD